jgi:CheY-like chemotaxis protein
VVDDYAPFRNLVCSTLHKQPELHIIGEASDGLEAIQKVQELQPDLILLDIGLPRLNGIEVSQRIQRLNPKSKILIVSENRSRHVAEEALRSGASGYLVKSDAALELLLAVKSVLEGKRFLSSSLAAHDLAGPSVSVAQHEAGLYSDDRWLLEDVTQFLGTRLRAGNAAIVVATESHRNIFLRSLGAFGLDIGAVIQQGRYIALDADEMLSKFMFNGMPDPERFMKAFGDLILRATKAVKGRVAIFGECAPLTCARGNAEAAIQIERLANQLIDNYDIDILCGYSLSDLGGMMDEYTHRRIRAEHSAVHFH